MDELKRIQLLTDVEISDLYDLPAFNVEERELFFTLNQAEEKALSQYKNARTRVYFILQLGYFKAKQQFFSINFEVIPDDVNFILKCHLGRADANWIGSISRNTIRAQRRDILALFNYRLWSTDLKSQTQNKLNDLIRYFPKGHSALRQLLLFLDRQRITIPSYRTFQDMFSEAFSTEEARLQSLLLSIPACWQKQLSELIEDEDKFKQLNLLRADQKDFRFTAVKLEIEKAQRIEALYNFAEQFLPTLKISKNAIRYYADIVEQYAAFRLRRLSQTRQWLNVLCFIFHRYQQIIDNLIVSFLYHTRYWMSTP